MEIRKIVCGWIGFLLLSGCGVNSAADAQPQAAVQDDRQVRVSNASFPIAISGLLELFSEDEFYPELEICTVTEPQSALPESETTLYVIEEQPEVQAEASAETTAYPHTYTYEGLTVIYNGQDQRIIEALQQKLGQP